MDGRVSGRCGQTLDGLESIDLTKPMSVITGGIKAVSGAVKTLFSLGGIINWNGSNAKEVQATMERLTNRNEMLQTSIEDLTDTIKQSQGTKSVAASATRTRCSRKRIRTTCGWLWRKPATTEATTAGTTTGAASARHR